MTEPLNLLIHGDPASCRQIGAWFRDFAADATRAADETQNARTTANAGWWGPAERRFVDVAYGPVVQCDDLALTCTTFGAAMDQFAGSLEAALTQMADTAQVARDGHLRVDTNRIHPPDRAAMVGAGPELPQDPSPADVETHNRQVGDYNARVDAYNARVDVFNTCGDMVKDVRNKLDEAHVILEEALRVGDLDLDVWQVGNTSAQTALDAIAIRDDGRQHILKSLNALSEQTAFYTEFAMAKRPSDLTNRPDWPEYRDKLLGMSGTRDRYLAYLRLLEAGLPESMHAKRIPTGVGLARRARMGEVPRFALHAARTVGRGVPIAGDVFTVIDELVKVHGQEQSWRAALIRSGTLIAAGYAGSWVGMKAGAEVGDEIAGPVGASIGVMIGAALGDAYFTNEVDGALDKVLVKAFPDDINPVNNQPRAEHTDHARPR